nr:uncharacterized protein LOC111837808 [Paramormyrops kingsleyae]
MTHAPAILKVILGNNSSQRLNFQNGLPDSVSELVTEVQRQCGIKTNFRLQFMDALFENEFLNLTSVDEIQDRGTIKIVPMTEASALQCADIPSTSETVFCPPLVDETSSMFSVCVDTNPLSTTESETSTSRQFWPTIFHVPQFSFDAELKLQRGNAAYKEMGTFLIPDLKLKSNILEGLVQEIVKYKVYATDKEFNVVGEALISKHPCLKEKGSLTGYAGWKASLKNKLAIYRTHLRKLGCPEVLVNSLKHKPADKANAAVAIKKPRRSEVNYCPPHPIGESDESLENLRVALLSEVKKNNNREVIRMKMEKTFSHRRYEVVRHTPMIQDFKARWPALFDINAEFKRITTMALQSRFLSQIDILSDKLLKVFQKRGGQRRLQTIMEPMAQDDDVDAGRECIIKGLCVYLNEDPDNMVKEYVTVRVQQCMRKKNAERVQVNWWPCTSPPDDENDLKAKVYFNHMH